jgi:hypothetical protein
MWEYAFLNFERVAGGGEPDRWRFISGTESVIWWEDSWRFGESSRGGPLTIQMLNRAGREGWLVSPSAGGYILRRAISATDRQEPPS